MVFGWGSNSKQQIEDSTEIIYSSPTLISIFNLQNIIKLSCGDDYSIALLGNFVQKFIK